MFECHVTCEKPGDLNHFNNLANSLKWKTSFIDGDPVLGNKVFFYFRCHSKSYDSIFEKMAELNNALGLKSIRSKIEHIVYNTKTGIGAS